MSSAKSTATTQATSIVMLGATGAVGSQVVHALIQSTMLKTLTLLGRRPLKGIEDPRVVQLEIDIFTPDSYSASITAHQCAICTLGVGQPSKMSREDFVKIDKTAVLDFAIACKQAGISHFQLLSSVGVDDQSRSFYLRTKGELQERLIELNFERLSLIQPSMILTPENRLRAIASHHACGLAVAEPFDDWSFDKISWHSR